jgi:hypothetical protein
MQLSSWAATWAQASPALGSRGLSLAGKSDSTRYTVLPEGFARPYFMRIRLCASNRRRLSSPRRRRLARFLSALFEVGAGDSDSDAESAMGRVAICAGSREKGGLRSGGCQHRGWRKECRRAQIWPRLSPAKRQRPPCRSNCRAFRRVATSPGHGGTQPPRRRGSVRTRRAGGRLETRCAASPKTARSFDAGQRARDAVEARTHCAARELQKQIATLRAKEGVLLGLGAGAAMRLWVVGERRGVPIVGVSETSVGY